jgi:glycerol-3-phosphate dehydrogenase
MNSYDVIIVGGGVVGCLTARALARYELKVLLIEKESDIGAGASSANSAIIHSGEDPLPGTLKAEMNHLANPMWDQLAGELEIPFTRSGAYVVAIGDESEALIELHERAKKNGVPSQILSHEEMLKREPRINPATSGALFTPTAGMVDPFAACLAPIENAIENGVEVLTGTAFEDFILNDKQIVGVKTNRGEFACRWVINAAGVYSDEVMHKAGVRPEFKIHPRRGEYFILDKAELEMKNILFPVPSEFSKGILVLGSTHGNTLIGPNSNVIEDRENRSVTMKVWPRSGLARKNWYHPSAHAASSPPLPACVLRGMPAPPTWITPTTLSSRFPKRSKDWSTWVESKVRVSPPRRPLPNAWSICSRIQAKSWLRRNPTIRSVKPVRVSIT